VDDPGAEVWQAGRIAVCDRFPGARSPVAFTLTPATPSFSASTSARRNGKLNDSRLTPIMSLVMTY